MVWDILSVDVFDAALRLDAEVLEVKRPKILVQLGRQYALMSEAAQCLMEATKPGE